MKLYQGIIRRIHQLSDGVSKVPPRMRIYHQVSPPPSAIAPSSSLMNPCSSILADDHSEGSSTAEHERHGTGEESTNRGRCTDVFFAHATTADWCNVGQVSIGILPNDILPDIFDFILKLKVTPIKGSRHGTPLFTCVEDGAMLFLDHHVA
jgi:hypothetical protein